MPGRWTRAPVAAVMVAARRYFSSRPVLAIDAGLSVPHDPRERLSVGPEKALSWMARYCIPERDRVMMRE